jgi:hypothetical protein
VLAMAALVNGVHCAPGMYGGSGGDGMYGGGDAVPPSDMPSNEPPLSSPPSRPPSLPLPGLPVDADSARSIGMNALCAILSLAPLAFF